MFCFPAHLRSNKKESSSSSEKQEPRESLRKLKIDRQKQSKHIKDYEILYSYLYFIFSDSGPLNIGRVMENATGKSCFIMNSRQHKNV